MFFASIAQNFIVNSAKQVNLSPNLNANSLISTQFIIDLSYEVNLILNKYLI